MSIDQMDDYTLNLALKYGKYRYKACYEQGKKDAVKHGHWIFDETIKNPRYQIKTCSLCGCRVNGSSFNYCPNCGSMMDGEKNER